MGKTEHASFSSFSKPKFALFMKKTNQKQRRRNPREDKRNESSEDKTKRHFWRKWLNYVRGHWSNHETMPNDKMKNYDSFLVQGGETVNVHSKPEEIKNVTSTPGELGGDVLSTPGEIGTVSQKLKELGGDVLSTFGKLGEIPSKAKETTGKGPLKPEFDIVEIPDEPGKKISKILIEPTKLGIKALITQQREPLPSWGNLKIVPGELQLEKKLSEEKIEIDRLCSKISRKETPEVDGSLVSTVFSVRQNLEPSKDSNSFSELNSLKSYRRTDDTRSKSKEERKGLRFGSISNEKILATLKTPSEPTWTEKETLRKKMRIQENLNELLEQFMFLEAENLMDFTIPQKSLVESNRLLHFNRVSGMKDIHYSLSKEVSPEILVNIKPFKEYLSEDFMAVDGSRGNLFINNKIFVKEEKKSKESRKAGDGSKIVAIDQERKPEALTNCLLQAVDIVNKKQDANQEAEEKEINTICYEDFRERLSVQVDVSKKSTSGCTIWGVYKSYSSCNDRKMDTEEKGTETEERGTATEEDIIVETKEEWKKKKETTDEKEETEEEREEIQFEKQSVDEVLDSLDDSDHDVIFRKNISQFKKKISGSYRHDSNCSLSSVRYQQHQWKPKSREKKMETCRYELLNFSQDERKLDTTLETHFLFLIVINIANGRHYETKLSSETIVLLENPQKAREVFVKQERNSSTLVEKEMPAPAKECLTLVELIPKIAESTTSLKPTEGSDTIPSSSEVWKEEEKKEGGRGKEIGGGGEQVIEEEDGESKKRSVSETFINSGRTFSQHSEQLLFNAGQKHEANADGKTTSGEIKNNRQEILENRTVVVRKGRVTTELAYLPISTALQVLNDPQCHYGVIVCEKPCSPANPFVSRSEPNVAKKTVIKTKTLISDSAFGDQEIPWPLDSSKSSSFEVLDDGTDRDSSCDGFRIIYNSNLEADFDGAKAIVPSFGCLLGKNCEKIKVAGGKPDTAASRTLRYKSNSFPKETVDEPDRSRRSFIPTQKRRTFVESDPTKRTGSVKLRNESFVQKKSFKKKEPFGDIFHSEEFKTILLERRKMTSLNKSTPSVRKELAAALSSIKELNANRDGNGRMSLVIMFSKK